MNNLNKANEKRKELALNKIYNFTEYGCKSFKQLIDKNVFIKSEVSQEPKIKYNRVKFNRMNYAEQAVYEAKMKELKTAYYLYYDERVMTECSKFVYEYFQEYKNLNSCIDCDIKITEEDKKYSNSGFGCCKNCNTEAEEVKKMLNII